MAKKRRKQPRVVKNGSLLPISQQRANKKLTAVLAI